MSVRLFLLVFVCLFSAFAAFSQTVIEPDSSVAVDRGYAFAKLAIDSEKAGAVAAKVELLDPNNIVRAAASRSVTLKRGKQAIDFRLDAADFVESADDNLAWYRLRYRIGDGEGIVSMSQLVRDLFELRIIAADNLLTGMTYRARVRAVNPFHERPVAGVKVEVDVEIDLAGDDNKKLNLKATSETDSEGFAVVAFAIPPDTQLDGDGEIKVTGRKNGIFRDAEEDLNALKDDTQVLSMADKPIYQPGQMLNFRCIVLKGGEAKTILAGSEIEFRIEDDDDTLLYREKVRSSEYGVAAIGWRIPANAKLGDYSIEIRDANGEQVGSHRVKVSRYDLPNFAVVAKPSKPYYLPADKDAEIEIRADFLFGKPVTKGKVRVVQEKSREWNWKEQKYEIDEGEVREGEADADGKFTAKFELAETHESLDDAEYYKYKDVKFAAYFTDLTTNKTEQRRFDVRVSREPVHVYLIRDQNFGNSKLPMKGYVSTFYADGSPAECDIEIKASLENEDKFKTVGRTKTNSFGAGRIAMPRPDIGDADDDLDFRIIAKDKSGRRGTDEDEVYVDDDEDAIRVSPDRSIYKPGDTMKIRIDSTVKTGTVYIDVVQGWSVIDSRFANLKDGKTEIRIPYSENFKGELKIAAFMEDPTDDDDLIQGGAGVIFPAKQGINVEATFDKAVYKPNEEATVKFGILDVVGQAVESALGVVVFDKAVEERARTDADFGGYFRGFAGWLGYGDSFGGINVKNLNELDLTKPIPDEMQLVAEVILHDSYYMPNVFRSRNYYDEAASVFSVAMSNQFQSLRNALQLAYEKDNFLHPTNDESFRRVLDRYGVDFDSFFDPWGIAYKPKFSVEKNRDIVTIGSAGPDKAFGTKDDFTAFSTGFEYFTPMGHAIDNAVKSYNARTGDFIRDEKTLFAELDVRELLDRFGRAYRVIFDGEGRFIQLRLQSSGADGKFEQYDWYGDDFSVWTSKIDFFADAEKKIAEIQTALKKAPLNEAEFKATLKAKGVDFDSYRDGNNNSLFITVTQRSRYWDKVTIETVQNFADPRSRTERRVVTPVTQQVIEFTIKGRGRDRITGTYDDVTLTQIVHVLSEQSKDDLKPIPVMQPIAFSSGTGSIAGTITDAQGAIISGSTVTATDNATIISRSVTSDNEGGFLIANLPVGSYSVRAEAANFKAAVVQNVSVTASTTSSLNITLEIGGVSEVVNVTSSAENTIETSSSMLSTTINGQRITSLPVNARAMELVKLQPGAVKGVTKTGDDGTEQQTSTPRLREYFPETLLWQPEIVTDASGKAELKFRMADNITTWKMYTIASTKNGKIGVAEKEVTAFQSFFVDLDPPKFLTNGDEIFLPTQVRNYTDKKQNVGVTMTKADWFNILNGDVKRIAVASGQSENAVFGFKAVMPVKEGKQRVTALAETDSDAIERPVTVRPDGREIVQTESRYITGSDKLEINFPANAIANTQSAELRIYPNPLAHVAESVEGLLQRPYGCGEQTISSTYPNVMILKFAAPGDGRPRRISESVERKARKYLQSGYERLIGYQVADGGFSYWGGKDSADFALTAYALRFLADASAFVAVDTEAVKRAEDWLIKQQRADGSWNKKYNWEEREDEKRAKITTTYVARTLAMVRAVAARSLPPAVAGGSSQSAVDAALAKAIAYLKLRNGEIDDPYSLSLFGLAALDAGDEDLARSIAEKLATLAREESGGSSWNLESNTAFNGWGAAGRVETTALVTQLFTGLKTERDLVGRAMIFLLKNKDRYGVWYSTQTTVNVLDAFVASSALDEASAQRLQVVLNGTPLTTIDIERDKLDQITVDLNGKLSGEKNTLELRSSAGTPLMAQVVSAHYIDWRDADSTGRTVNNSRALRLDYKCDRTDAAIMQEVSCAVEAERIGYRGYGMLLAEIGTPPGADVSRESLQAAMDADWSISRYDILSDRIVLYMWSKAGGTKFNFKFRPRYGINAQTPASVVYDYYNPEAQATAPPVRFVVK